MKKILLTGFGPFVGHPTNPTYDLVTHYNQRKILGHKIEGCILPVSFSELFSEIRKVDLASYDLILSFGVAGSRKEITPERVAINWMDTESDRPDNDGRTVHEKKVLEDGPPAYFSRLPIKKIKEALNKKEIACSESLSAGSYICNQAMYLFLDELEKRELFIPYGFIHIPTTKYLFEENRNLAFEEIIKCTLGLE